MECQRVHVIQFGIPSFEIIDGLLVAQPHPHDGMRPGPQDFAIDLAEQRLAGRPAGNLDFLAGGFTAVEFGEPIRSTLPTLPWPFTATNFVLCPEG